MFHAVKRKVALAQQPIKSAPNAEFADLKQRLQSIKQSLKYASSMLDNANRNWILQMQQQRNFSDRFYESYPTPNDELYLVSQQFAFASQQLYNKFTRETSEEVVAYQSIHKQVSLYIREIEQVESMYAKLTAAKSEAIRYQSKLDSMERSRRQTDETKKARNLQKMDNEKEVYRKLLASTIAAQKKTYAKHPIVYKAALTSYWLSHEKHVKLLVKSLEATQKFAEEAQEEMKDLDIAQFCMPEELSPLPSPKRSPTKVSLHSEDKEPEAGDSPTNITIVNSAARAVVSAPAGNHFSDSGASEL